MRANAMIAALGLATAVATGCIDQPADDDPSGGGKADGDGTCTDPKYGDGTCHIDLGCGIPDVDCFKPFATDDEAYNHAVADGMSVLPTSDPHFAKAREKVDASWALYRAGVPLGKLAEQRMSVVLMNDPTVNAFVMPSATPGVGYTAVFVNIGMLDSAMTDDQYHGIFFHELTHLAKLHVSDEVFESTRRYYVLPDDSEELRGSTQINHDDFKTKMKEWGKLPDLISYFDDEALGNYPVGGWANSLLGLYLGKIKTTLPGCLPQINAFADRGNAFKITYHDQQLHYPADWAVATKSAYDALKICLASDKTTYAQFRAGLDANWVTYLATNAVPEDAMLDALPALDGVLGLVGSRRATMRKLEADIATSSGRPFTSLRFFSTEEEADDVSARLTKLNNLTETGVTGFLTAALKPEEQAACTALLDAGGILPYGRILSDDHHADCWRIAHARQVAEHASERATPVRERAPEPWVPTRVRRGPIH